MAVQINQDLVNRIGAAVKSGHNRDIGEFATAIRIDKRQYQDLRKQVKALATNPKVADRESWKQLLSLFPVGRSGADGATFLGPLPADAMSATLDAVSAVNPNVRALVAATESLPDDNRTADNIADAMDLEEKDYRRLRNEFAAKCHTANVQYKDRFGIRRGPRGATKAIPVVDLSTIIAPVVAETTTAPAKAPATKAPAASKK
jgi:hypothetical protein